MEQLTINLPKKIADQLKEVSAKIGVKPEDLLLVSLKEKLENMNSDFTDAMKYILNKNSELYKRHA